MIKTKTLALSLALALGAATLPAAQAAEAQPAATAKSHVRNTAAANKALVLKAYQALFGGDEYRQRLQQLRQAALQAMRLLQPFEPRLVGAVVSGAITRWHRIQIHAFADAPELVDFFLENRGIPFRQDERSFRFPDGQQRSVPLARFEAGETGIDLAVFDGDAYEVGSRSRAQLGFEQRAIVRHRLI